MMELGTLARFATTVEERDFYQQRYHVLMVHYARIAAAADQVLKCLYEFAPEYPQAASEYCQALDDALAAAEAAGCLQRPWR